MKVKRKLKNRTGFSLGEMLVTVIILLLASTIVATGVPAAKKAYEKVVVGANARALLSTTIATLRDELTTARDVKVDGTTITYYNADNGAESKIYKDLEDNVIMLEEYTDRSPLPGVDANAKLHEVDPRALVSSKAVTDGLSVVYTSVTSDGETIKFAKLSVCWGDKELASVDNLTIRFIIPSPTPAAA